ncbi:tetratricopeptide repeat protein [Methanotorris formicicus]|uniref:tetratricopeptide repeat protein n=1 Tax=Methanotorris formicicus TaxID=213185 RepID=UPI001FE1346A|nr:tetratricopeptide repeat protein [Methanotorris formicicus]
MRLVYNDLSTLYEDIDKILSEIDILSLSNKDINSWKLWKNLGDKAYLCSAFYEALFCYNKALEINPENAELLCKKGYALLKLHKRELAIKYFKRTLNLDKNHYKALFGLGEAYYSMSDEKNSIKCFEKVLELKPDNINLILRIAYLYFELKKYEDALKYFEKALF